MWTGLAAIRELRDLAKGSLWRKTPNQHELRLRLGARMVTVPDGTLRANAREAPLRSPSESGACWKMRSPISDVSPILHS